AHETKIKAIVVVHPWGLETEQTQVDLHVKIKSAGMVTERLLRASTLLADTALIVDAEGKNVKDLAIPGLGEITLIPGGVHIVLSGLMKALLPYDSFYLTLEFEKAGVMQVEVLVEEKTSDAWRLAPSNFGKHAASDLQGSVLATTYDAIASRQ